MITDVFNTKVNNGLIGSFAFNDNGDLTSASGAAVLFTIYKGTNHLVTLLTAAPRRNSSRRHARRQRAKPPSHVSNSEGGLKGPPSSF